MHIEGFEQTHDARLHIRLLHRASGAPDETLAESEHSVMMGQDGGAQTVLDLTLTAGTVMARCGDSLVLATTVLSGSSDFLLFRVVVTIP